MRARVRRSVLVCGQHRAHRVAVVVVVVVVVVAATLRTWVVIDAQVVLLDESIEVRRVLGDELGAHVLAGDWVGLVARRRQHIDCKNSRSSSSSKQQPSSNSGKKAAAAAGAAAAAAAAAVAAAAAAAATAAEAAAGAPPPPSGAGEQGGHTRTGMYQRTHVRTRTRTSTPALAFPAKSEQEAVQSGQKKTNVHGSNGDGT